MQGIIIIINDNNNDDDDDYDDDFDLEVGHPQSGSLST